MVVEVKTLRVHAFLNFCLLQFNAHKAIALLKPTSASRSVQEKPTTI